MNNCITAHQPEILVAPLSRSEEVESLCLEPEERTLSCLVKLVAAQNNLAFESFEAKAGRKINKIKQGIEELLKIVKFFIENIKLMRMEKVIVQENNQLQSRPVFFTTPSYNMDKLYSQYQTQFPDKRFYFLPGPIISPFEIRTHLPLKNFNILFSQLAAAIRKEERIFTHYNINFSHIVCAKIMNNISSYIMSLMLWIKKLNQFIDKTQPSMIFSTGNRRDDIALAELCEEKKIRDILISHGSHVFPKNAAEINEWGEHGNMLVRAPFSHLALQTPCAEEYFDAFPVKATLLKTGPLIWGMNVNREKAESIFYGLFGSAMKREETKVILHTGTPKPAKTLRFFVYETPDEYTSALRDLAIAVERLPHTVLIIKFRPSSEISVSNLQSLVPFSERVILSVDHPFLDVLGMADLLASFSSTAIEEALQNKIPVLLYGGQGRYQHLSGFTITQGTPVAKSAIYHIACADTLEYGIKNILDLKIDGQKLDAPLFNRYIYNESEKDSLKKLFTL